MSLIVSAEQIMAQVQRAGGDARILHKGSDHEHSRKRWMSYRDCQDCLEIARSYDRSRKRRLRDSEDNLRCPCVSCMEGA